MTHFSWVHDFYGNVGRIYPTAMDGSSSLGKDLLIISQKKTQSGNIFTTFWN